MPHHHHHDDHEAFDFVNAVPEETRMKEAASTASVAKFAGLALVAVLLGSLAYGVVKPTPLPEIKHHAGGHEAGHGEAGHGEAGHAAGETHAARDSHAAGETHAAGESHSTESAAGGH